MSDATNAKAAANLDRMVVIKAMQHLKALKKALKLIRNDRTIWIEAWNALFLERRKLIERHTAYQEAAWRMTIGQTIRERDAGVFDIYDHWTGKFVPVSRTACLDGISLQSDSVVHLTNQSPGGLPDGNYKIKDVAQNTAGTPKNNGEPGVGRVKGSHANKLTTEQRRENGRKGAAVKKENRMNNVRFEEAKQTRKCQVYALVDGQLATFLGARTQIGIADQLGQGEVMAGTCEAYCVFTPDRQLWVYNPSLKKMIRKRF